jgi:glycosyltransferase involved in cell wall biosynthesis
MSHAAPSVAFLPTDPNPYQRLLAGGLAEAGVEVTFLPGLPTAGWLREHQGRIDVLHFHWLHKLYMARYRTPVQAAAFFSRFRLARRLGYKVVWTAHNILPHKRRPAALHLAARRLMMAEADAVIAHCAAGRDALLARFPRPGPIHIIPIGHYAGVYPRTMERDDARARMGLRPEQFVFLLLGNIAPYKGLERFVRVFRDAAGPDDAALIAGNVLDTGLARRLGSACAPDPRLRLDAGHISDTEMQTYLLAADALVAPFEEVLTSSSVILGLSWGLPVVVPALGCLPELVPPGAGIVYRPGSDETLASSLHEIKRLDPASARLAAASVATALDWTAIGRQTAQVYRARLEP